ncbi:N-methylhydantoinase A [Rhodoligotrophos appendicifer]|uniref:hydantoinase/oxoprolinase family protein n=1 Tax=Rhodoligotrophos appendicifer TaxID=987056 RepID=UPI001960FE75|nr:hydantoinase/oxoprolinase family protein [Rhodoligotrophos appendicifer]
MGIEIGGTFTDLIAVSDSGQIESAKALSTPSNPALGALDALLRWRPDASGVTSLVHGSTVATNAVIERKGAPTALLVTEGHRDILEIQRHEKSDIFDMHYTAPQPLVPRQWSLEVRERLDATGAVVTPLSCDLRLEAELRQLVERDGISSVAVCLLHSYLDPRHERELEDWLRERFPSLQVSLSSVVNPEYREYERASTTVMSAYLRPVVAGYMGEIERLMQDNGLQGNIQIMQSSGGIIPIQAAKEKAVNVVLSGPAAGVVGAVFMGGLSGVRDFITLDMGGTSTDVCLVRDLQATLSYDNKVDGLPVRAPTFDIQVVGAGGGSIAAVDAAGYLRVGPRSAGADPGPCCYGRGGTEPTTTDATALMGILRPHRFFGGALELRLDLAAAAIGRLSQTLQLSALEVAEGIRRIANSNMTETIRLISIERGHNPRDFALLAFGGAGALHACEVADDLMIDTVVVPEHQGVLSALGLLASDFTVDLVKAHPADAVALDIDALAAAFDALDQAARTEFARYGLETKEILIERAVDIRYRGQASELSVPVADSAIGPSACHAWIANFHALYKERFGHSFPEKQVQIVNLRLVARKEAGRITMASKPEGAAPRAERSEIYFGGQLRQAEFFWRPDLPAGFTCAGPAIVEDHFATSFVPPDWSLTVHDTGTLILTRSASAVEAAP